MVQHGGATIARDSPLMKRPSLASVVRLRSRPVDFDIEGNVRVGDGIGRRHRQAHSIGHAESPGSFPVSWRFSRRRLFLRSPKKSYARSLRLLTPRGRKSTEPEIQFHYGRRHDFYALWLDPSMPILAHTIGRSPTIWPRRRSNKLNHILPPSFGSSRRSAARYWLRVGRIGDARSRTTMERTQPASTLSAAQAEYAERKIAEKGLSERCRVQMMDFRESSC